ncbi:MAG TPA: SIR2 family protein [Longimicrobium sp.]
MIATLFGDPSRPKTFLVGAGISRDAPASLPTGAEFSAAILDAVVAGDSFLAAAVAPLMTKLWAGALGCRLEVLLEIARDGLGDAVVGITECLLGGSPNQYHFELAAALNAGHTVVTVNFDMLIEAAYEALYGPHGLPVVASTAHGCASLLRTWPPRTGLLFKIHGSLRDTRGRRAWGSIQATLASMSNGLPGPKKNLLRKVLRDHDVVIMGYSGMDDFDITPCLRSDLPHARVLWIHHEATRMRLRSSTALARATASAYPSTTMVARVPEGLLATGRTRAVVGRIPFYPRVPTGRGTHGVTVDWKRKMVRAIASFSLSRYQRLRYVAKLLQHNGLLAEAEACFLEILRSVSGFDRATTLDDLAQCKYLQRAFAEDLRLRAEARRKARADHSRSAAVLVGGTWLGSGESYRNIANYRSARAAFERALACLPPDGEFTKRGYALSGIAGIDRMRSRFPEAYDSYQAAIACFKRSRHLAGALYAEWGIAEVQKYWGNLDRAMRHHESVHRSAEAMGHRTLTGGALWGRAELHRIRAEFGEAASLYEEALDRFPPGDLAGCSWVKEGIAQVKAATGKSPIRELTEAESGFVHLRATLGFHAVLLDRTLFLLQEGRPADARAELGRARVNELPPRDRANYYVVAGQAYGIPRGEAMLRKAERIYRRLEMHHAQVGVGILLLESRGVLSTHDGNFAAVRRLARAHDYSVELRALSALALSGGGKSGYRFPLY